MTLDGLGRDAGRAALLATAREVDVSAGLADLKRRHRRHVVTARTATATVLLAVVTVVALLVRTVGAETHPVDTPPKVRSCATAVCTGSGPYEVELPAPLVWTVPQGYEQHLAGTVVSARQAGAPGRSALVVLEDVRGGDFRAQARDRVTASDLATWMQAAPELRVSGVARTTVAGLPAIRMTVRPTTGFLLFGTSGPIPAEDQLDESWFPAGGAFDISGYLQRSWAYVATPQQRSDVWLLDVPGGPVTAVVRPVSSNAATVAAQDSLLASLRFPRG